MLPTVTVVIPAYNAGDQLRRCLESLAASSHAPLEVIVVDDGSTDNSPSIIAGFPVKSLHTGGRRGPAFARNLGARAAAGDLLFFIDSDVCVQPGTIESIVTTFARDEDLDALIGSYDNDPHSRDFLSQYRNLMHAWVHQTGDRRASTFWSGCGSIRRTLFLEHSGFDENYGRPAIEDIELGYRLVAAGRKIILDPTLQIKHLKRWTFWGLLKTDILDRGIPWTELILRDRNLPNDLNLQLNQRVSVALAFCLAALSAFMAWSWGQYFLLPFFAILFALLLRYWIEFALPTRPGVASFLVLAGAGIIVVMASTRGMFGLVPPLLLCPLLLMVRHRYTWAGRRQKLFRAATAVYIAASILLATMYFPAHGLMLAAFLTLATLGLINSRFYIFLARNRGLPFMLAAIPFHLLYFFYCGLSFGAGLLFHLSNRFVPQRKSAGQGVVGRARGGPLP